MDASNHRPITLLNLNSKLLENIVCGSLDKHLKDHGLLHENQWGFEKSFHRDKLFLTEKEKRD